MRTRSGSWYSIVSMAMEDISPHFRRNRKRKLQPSVKEPVISVSDVYLRPFDRNSKRPKLTDRILETVMEVEKQMMKGRSGCEIEFGIDEKSKRRRNENRNWRESDYFDRLPDDLVILIMSKLSASSDSPSDLICARLTCKRFNELGQHPWVLARASTRCLSLRAELWSESAHSFLKSCADAGSLEACYILGMIHFYCLENRRSGAAYMAKAAMGSHPSAIYSLAIIQFNGSGGSRSDKDLRAGVTLCARAAYLGHVDALRELGHCLQDGYGVRQNVAEGRRLLAQANARELASCLSHYRHVAVLKEVPTGCIPLLSDFELSLVVPNPHPANRFLVEWFKSRAGKGEARDQEELWMCSHVRCGRIETRRHEFRRCSVCGKANYCSRACQAMDWKLAHRAECSRADAEAPHVGDVVQMVEVAGEAV